MVALQGTGGPNLLVYGSMASVTDTTFVFFDNGMAYTAPGLLALDGIHPSQRGKRVFAQELVGLIDRALNQM